MLQAGSIAPDFKLLNAQGELFQLAEALMHNNVVLYFYPKDDTPGCIKEACAFRDNLADFKDF
jgi:peroxiredoxin Q/BCP